MTNNDILHRFLFENEPVRGEYVHLETSLQTILAQHAYPPPIRKLLGEALCVAALLSAILKFKGKLTVQFRGKGKLKLLFAQCNQDFQLRGLVKTEGDLSPEELVESFKDGILAIMLDGGAKQPQYQGIVPWVGDSLAESIEGYFKASEQLPTKLWLSVSDEQAVGFLLQVLPVAEKDARGLTEEIIEPSFARIVKKTGTIDPDVLLGLPYESLLNYLYRGETLRVFDPVPVSFACTCSRKRSEEAIRLLGREEAEEEIEGKNSIIVTCEFCNKEYVFDRIDVASIFDAKNQPPGDTHLH